MLRRHSCTYITSTISQCFRALWVCLPPRPV